MKRFLHFEENIFVFNQSKMRIVNRNLSVENASARLSRHFHLQRRNLSLNTTSCLSSFQSIRFNWPIESLRDRRADISLADRMNVNSTSETFLIWIDNRHFFIQHQRFVQNWKEKRNVLFLFKTKSLLSSRSCQTIRRRESWSSCSLSSSSLTMIYQTNEIDPKEIFIRMDVSFVVHQDKRLNRTLKYKQQLNQHNSLWKDFILHMRITDSAIVVSS